MNKGEIEEDDHWYGAWRRCRGHRRHLQPSAQRRVPSFRFSLPRIEWVFATDAAGEVIACQKFAATDDEAKITFVHPEGKTLSIFGYCNKHGGCGLSATTASRADGSRRDPRWFSHSWSLFVPRRPLAGRRPVTSEGQPVKARSRCRGPFDPSFCLYTSNARRVAINGCAQCRANGWAEVPELAYLQSRLEKPLLSTFPARHLEPPPSHDHIKTVSRV